MSMVAFDFATPTSQTTLYCALSPSARLSSHIWRVRLGTRLCLNHPSMSTLLFSCVIRKSKAGELRPRVKSLKERLNLHVRGSCRIALVLSHFRKESSCGSQNTSSFLTMSRGQLRYSPKCHSIHSIFGLLFNFLKASLRRFTNFDELTNPLALSKAAATTSATSDQAELLTTSETLDQLPAMDLCDSHDSLQMFI